MCLNMVNFVGFFYFVKDFTSCATDQNSLLEFSS